VHTSSTSSCSRSARLDASEGGLGAGLTLVRSLVAMHGGTVTARSRGDGLGRDLVVRLQLASAPVEDEAAPSHDHVRIAGTQRPQGRRRAPARAPAARRSTG